jgi:hypothetical protein
MTDVHATTPTSPAVAPTDPARRQVDLDALRAYVRTLADRMGLRDWTVDVGYIPDKGRKSHPLCYIQVDDIPTRSATFYAHADFFDETPEARRLTVVEELLYCHFAGMYDDERVCDVNDLADQLFASIKAAAAAWAPALPLPLVGLMKRADKVAIEGDRGTS